MSATDIESPKTFTLRAPIQVGKDGETVTELTLNEPTAGDIEQLQRDTEKHGAATALIYLMGRQTKLAPLEIRKIGARDFNHLQGYLGSFLEPDEKSSEN